MIGRGLRAARAGGLVEAIAELGHEAPPVLLGRCRLPQSEDEKRQHSLQKVQQSNGDEMGHAEGSHGACHARSAAQAEGKAIPDAACPPSSRPGDLRRDLHFLRDSAAFVTELRQKLLALDGCDNPQGIAYHASSAELVGELKVIFDDWRIYDE